jgi:hypothetical protein
MRKAIWNILMTSEEKADIVLTGLTVTGQRVRYLRFSEYYSTDLYVKQIYATDSMHM